MKRAVALAIFAVVAWYVFRRALPHDPEGFGVVDDLWTELHEADWDELYAVLERARGR